MKAVRVPIFALSLMWGIDTLETFTLSNALAFAAKGCAFRIGYIDKVTPEEIISGQSAGVGFMPVTYALEFDGAHTVERLRELGLPQGITVWLDVEGTALDAATLTTKINAWDAAVVAAGFVAGLYVGAGCPLTDAELQALAVTRYWRSVSRVVAPASRQFCMCQHRPANVTIAGVVVDVDTVEPDFNGDVPMMAL